MNIIGGLNVAQPEPWTEQALCAQVDMDLWFPDVGESTRLAKMVCGKCPVREQCLEYALQRGEQHGIWGGHTFRDRAKMRRARRAA